MKSSKERKMDRKAKHKALAVEKTVKSRQRRLDNKAKRDEIHAINPDVKVKIVNEKTYIDGWEFAVENGKLICKEPTEIVNEQKTHEDKVKEIIDIGEDLSEFIEPTVEVFNAEIEEVEAVEVDDVGKFQKLVNKWRL